MRAATLDDERAAAIDDWCRQRGIRCLYFLAAADDPQTPPVAEAAGYRFVDVRVTFGRRGAPAVTGSRGREADSPTLRLSRPEDLPTLRQIARESYRDTRFYFDRRFPRPLCDQLYETWIERSCAGYADAVLVAEAAGAPAGFISCHLEKGERTTGNIGLVGVHAQQRGRGLGQVLVDASLAWFGERGVDQVTVVTQARNLAAQRLYQRCGFLTQQVQLWFHRWYPPEVDRG